MLRKELGTGQDHLARAFCDTPKICFFTCEVCDIESSYFDRSTCCADAE